jgi:two-component system CheB/CheR fusion protein
VDTATIAVRPTLGNDGRRRLPGLNVLVAEDDPDGANMLGCLLEDMGHRVRVLYDGQDALTSALIDPPDVAILDIGLPRIDGWEVARRLRQTMRDHPCLLVAVTGHDRPSDRSLSRRAGFHLHLPKPVDVEALTRVFGSRRQPA